MSTMDTSKIRVAVIGAGPAGLAAMKNLLDEGFNVTGFDNRDGVGGVWRFTEHPGITSVTRHTKVQLSKFLMPFSDLPLHDDAPRYLTGEQLTAHYQEYARIYHLQERFEFNTTVKSLARSDDNSAWLLSLEGHADPRVFDKVVLASGSEHARVYPAIDNLGVFEGTYMHGQSYKGPEPFEDMNVVVMGQGNSAADCAAELKGHASSVYLAHTRGALIVPREARGKRLDASVSWATAEIRFRLGHYFPSLQRKLMWNILTGAANKAWGELDPAWGLDPEEACADNIAGIVVNDAIVPALRSGLVHPVSAIRRVVGPRSVELQDGTVLEDIDAIIAATGYRFQVDLLGSHVGYHQTLPGTDALPDLYQNIFPVDYADSLACLGYNIVQINAGTAREIASMAVAQVWAGKSKLPSRQDMMRQIERHREWFAERCRTNPSMRQCGAQIEPHEYWKFIHETAGTGLYENLGWSWPAWKFFVTSPKLYFTLAYGVLTPHLLRYFETGKRKAWDGALDAILHANQLSALDLKQPHQPEVKTV
ncbi:flavin monooxygenase-like protein [Stachybotrys elegans]|uniref:Flavin monooxygenase-like protein n=1 Tax=Stachybotrys elegans TaxID=80388 RepID=A0A8K0WPW3_9HYPO|nr:flavin monooxygenase-like protein [Stachybotrys elegans]